jgi:hypothetical protein
MNLHLPELARVKRAWSYRSEPESARVLASFLWHVLLALAIIVLITALWFGAGELDAASQVENAQTTSSHNPPPFDRAQLESTLGFYAAQQSQYQSLSQSPLPSVADPSK